MAIVATLAKLLMTVGLALTMSTWAGAVVSIGLEQVGGTYDPTVGAHAGDTLVLDITYSFEPGDTISIIDPAVVWDGAVSSYDAASSTETGAAAFTGGVGFLSPIVTGDDLFYRLIYGPVAENRANGWEKVASLGSTTSGSCVYGPGGSCTSMGTAAFVLSGRGGVISIGGIGQPGGTFISDLSDCTDQDITCQLGIGMPRNLAPISNLGSIRIIPNPEPSTGLLLAFGLIGIAAVRRRRAGDR